MVESTAEAIIQSMLRRYGLDYSKKKITSWVKLINADPANFELIEEEIRGSREFRKRFPAIEQRREAGLPAISVDEYLSLERSYRGIMRAARLPKGFYDSPTDYAKFIVNDVSPQELQTRVSEGYEAAKYAPQEIKDALQRFYGVRDTDSAIAAYFLDPQKSVEALQRQFARSQIAGLAEVTGFGRISKNNAARLEKLGYSPDESQQIFAALNADRATFAEMAGEIGGRSFTMNEQIDIGFESDQDLLEELERQRERRASAFSRDSGGGAASSNTGVFGLGSAE